MEQRERAMAAPADAPEAIGAVETVVLPPEEADVVLDELVAIASRMAMEQATQWSGRDPQEGEERRMAYARSLLEQEDAIRVGQPEFDLEQMLRVSTPFRALILAGEPVKRALEYIRPEEGARRTEQEVLERIRKRNTRPQAMDMTGRPASPSIEQRLDEEEMRRIDAQLKRGRKVYLEQGA